MVINAVLLLLVAAIAWGTGRSISKPLSALTVAMGRVAEDELEIEVPGLQRADELGAMARAVDHFRLLAKERHQLEDEQARARDQEEAPASQHRSHAVPQ